MRQLLKLFDLIRQAAAAFFKHDLTFKRSETGNVQLVLEAQPATAQAKPGKKVSRQQAVQHKDQQELALILEQLGALLAEVPESRAALRHLVFVEHALQKKGLKALHKLPLDVLQRALEQLEGLVTNWSPAGLANLRSKMAVAIIDREHQDPEAEGDAYRTAAVLDHAPAAPAAASPLEAVLMASIKTVPRAVDAAGPESAYETLDTGPGPFLDDDTALAQAYASLGAVAPVTEVEFQGELGSRSTRALAPTLPRVTETAGEIKLRVVQE
ncbi:MAG: hypothetical protein LH480_06975 [Rubrivivax sp.]|nr:hypothetical protein [Rubrivivax sp.]